MDTQAWQFTTSNLHYIKRIATSISKRRAGRIDADDLVNDICEMSVQMHARYDSARGTPQQWLYWVARNAARKYDRRYTRCEAHDAPMDFDAADYASNEALERKLDVDALKRVADAVQLAAIESVLSDADEGELPFGWNKHKRNLALYKLRGRV
jgi:DNA-directed RNA polymerase specialized sigma24 family protein